MLILLKTLNEYFKINKSPLRRFNDTQKLPLNVKQTIFDCGK